MRSLRVACCAAWLLLAGWAAAWSQTGNVPEAAPGGADALMPDMQDDLFPAARLRRSTERWIPNQEVPAMSGPVDPTAYRLGPGDVIRLQMWGRLSSSSTLQVGPEGVMLVPGVGTIRVAGRTLASVRTDVLDKLKRQFRGVGMDLRLARPRTFYVYLTGRAKEAGPIAATGANRVFDVVRPGVLESDASSRRIEVRHSDGSSETADLKLFARTGDSSLNPWLRDGDVIQVPSATEFIYAAGALAAPGRFELGAQDSLLTLFRLAGDPIPAAVVDRALVLHFRDPYTPESLWVRLDAVYSRQTNPVLHDGDRLYVYFQPQYHVQHEAAIYGEVGRPGSYPIVEGRHHLSDLLTAAGGFLPTADLSAVRVIRRNPSAGDRDPELDRLLRLSRDQLTMSEYDALNTKLAALREGYRIDWNRLQASPDQLDLLLRDGDVVRAERLVSSIRVDGQVRRPGIMTFRPGRTVVDYVREAGGFTGRAWNSRVQVTRAVTGQTLPASNIKALDPGDFIWVPERSDRTLLDHFLGAMIVAAQMATVVIAIRTVL